ncbi:bromodomain and WD repeat-containing protein 3-like [Dysidea avara]|uniref:bromodomain and WD repeat-containing protein 3-like n=1 Tax=Dysidea avara TaxID=196820 RepID=UPI0033331235
MEITYYYCDTVDVDEGLEAGHMGRGRGGSRGGRGRGGQSWQRGRGWRRYQWPRGGARGQWRGGRWTRGGGRGRHYRAWQGEWERWQMVGDVRELLRSETFNSNTMILCNYVQM